MTYVPSPLSIPQLHLEIRLCKEFSLEHDSLCLEDEIKSRDGGRTVTNHQLSCSTAAVVYTWRGVSIHLLIGEDCNIFQQFLLPPSSRTPLSICQQTWPSLGLWRVTAVFWKLKDVHLWQDPSVPSPPQRSPPQRVWSMEGSGRSGNWQDLRTSVNISMWRKQFKYWYVWKEVMMRL